MYREKSFASTLNRRALAGLLCVLLALSYRAANAAPTPVVIDAVTEETINAKIAVLGTVHSRNQTIITAGVDARLEWVAEPGTQVSEGDVLVRMDTAPLRLELAEQAALAKRAGIQAAYLAGELERISTLRKTQSVPEYELDQTRAQYELALAEQQIAKLKQQQLEDKLARATRTASFDGWVIERHARAGSDVSRADKLLHLVSAAELEVRVHVPAQYAAWIDMNDTLVFKAGGRQAQGKVSVKVPAVDPVSQTIEVRLAISADNSAQWATGELVTVDVPITDDTPRLTVHRDALVLNGGEAYVVVIDENNQARKMGVTPGAGTRNRIAVSGDLRTGDRVVVRGAVQLADGEKVAPQLLSN